MSMDDDAEAGGTTEAPAAGEEEATEAPAAEEGATEAPAAEEEASEAPAAEGGEAATEAAAEAEGGETTEAPAEESAEGDEAQAAGEEVAEALETTEAPAEGEEEAAEETPAIVADTPEEQQSVLEALKSAIDSSKLVFQNLTIVLPNFNPPPQALFDGLIRGGGSMLFGPGNLRLSDAKRPYYAPPNYGGSPPLSSGFVGPIVPQIGPPVKETLIDVDILNNRLKLNKKIKVLDASYEPEGNAVDPTTFQDVYYGKWEKLMKEKKGLQYARSHIPGAIHFNLNIATYPTWNDRQALYPADLFQQYVQRLGINKADEIVVYARGPYCVV